MYLDHDFVQVSKLNEDQKKGFLQNWNTFFPKFRYRPKKKVFTKNGTLFFLKFKWIPTLRCTPASNYRGDADVDHTQTIGGNTVKLLGGCIPPYPRVSAPLPVSRSQAARRIPEWLPRDMIQLSS